MNLKQVVLYRPGDAHPDNEVDIRDLVAAKKVLAGIKLDTKAGELGADVNKSGNVDNDDYNAICNHLIGLYTIEGYK